MSLTVTVDNGMIVWSYYTEHCLKAMRGFDNDNNAKKALAFKIACIGGDDDK